MSLETIDCLVAPAIKEWVDLEEKDYRRAIAQARSARVSFDYDDAFLLGLHSCACNNLTNNRFYKNEDGCAEMYDLLGRKHSIEEISSAVRKAYIEFSKIYGEE